MSDEVSVIAFNPRNIITIALCGVMGWALILLIVWGWKKVGLPSDGGAVVAKVGE